MKGPSPRPENFGLDVTIRDFAPGQVLFDRYQLKKILGRGGMGIVWQATDLRLEREVALKFVPDTVTFNPEAIENLKRETRRSLQLTHPNIMRIYDLVQDDTWACISMEFIEGNTLSAMKVAQPSQCFEVIEIRAWIQQLIEGLEYAHTRAKVIHRDLKPGNLMLTKAGEVKIADFGISRTLTDTLGQVTSAADSSGTLVFMSPQQSQGKMPTVADDVYSLGATLFDLLSGKPPFFIGDIAYQVAKIPPPSIAQRRLELGIGRAPVAAAWEQTIAACLAKDPAHRPASAAEVGRLLFGGPFAALPSAPVVTPAAITRGKMDEAVEAISQEALAALRKATETNRPSLLQSVRQVLGIIWNLFWLIVLVLLAWEAWRMGSVMVDSVSSALKLVP